jgi:hypothetical protein
VLASPRASDAASLPDLNPENHDFQTSPIDRLRLEPPANGDVRFDTRASQTSLFADIPRGFRPRPRRRGPNLCRRGHDDRGRRYEVLQSVRRRSLLRASERDHGGNIGACFSSAAVAPQTDTGRSHLGESECVARDAVSSPVSVDAGGPVPFFWREPGAGGVVAPPSCSS